MLDIPRVFLAVDGLSLSRVEELVTLIGSRLRGIKIHDLFDRDRCSVATLKKYRMRIWIDYKLHDTPDTVVKRSEALYVAGASIISCHASGGWEMLRKAVTHGAGVYAITALTSLSDDDICKIYHCTRDEAVKRLALIAAEADVQGIVCSPQEVKTLRAMPELANITLVTPSIRLRGQDANDQQRVGTPEQAIRDGADYIVVGRAITAASDPLKAFEAVDRSVRKGLAARAR